MQRIRPGIIRGLTSRGCCSTRSDTSASSSSRCRLTPSSPRISPRRRADHRDRGEGTITESAIPLHLETQRTRHKRVPDDYQPPYRSFVARYKPAVSRVVMAYFGVQYRGASPPAATDALKEVAGLFAGESGPSHWDRAQYLDQSGHENVVTVAYWDDVARFDIWFAPAREVWTGKVREGVGTFVEVLRPTVARHETLFSSLDRPEGVAVIAEGMSGEVQEHAYWG